MKTLFALIFSVFTVICSFSQSPNSFKYQAVLRDKVGQLISDKTVSVRISILQGTVNGISVYAESHSPKSNVLGTVNLEIGKGTLLSGSFNSIAWGSNAHFVKVEMDPAGGSNFDLVGVSQLLSVPYAMHAQTSADEKWNSVTGGINYGNGNVGIAKINPFYKLDVGGSINASQLLVNGSPLSAVSPWSASGSDVFYNNGNVGIGTSSPAVKLEINGGGTLNLFDLKNDNNSLGINAFVSSETDFHGSAFIGRRSRGTGATPSMVLGGDRITGIYGSMYANGNYQNASAIQMYVGANPGVNSYPVNIRFETTNSNEITRTERMRISEGGNIGIGTTDPKSKLQVENGDVYISDLTSGVIMKSPNGSCWRMKVDNSGTPVFTAISCP